MASFFIYARKSTESEDRQVLSIESQFRELEGLAKKRNLVISRTFTEAKSAKAPGRPQFGELMRLVERGKGIHILCWKLDRLSRNPLDSGRIGWALQERKILSIITPEKEYTDASDEQFIAQIEFGIAQKYIADLRKNVMRGMKTKAENGWFPSRAPLGYLNERYGDKGSRRILKDPVRFPLVRKLWDLILCGRCSVAEVCQKANNELGLTTRPSGKFGAKPLGISFVYKLLSNPFYCGQFRYAGQVYNGKHPAMISLNEFDQVQVLLGRNGRPRPKRHAFTFRGLMRCGECGAAVTAERKSKYIKSTGDIKFYTYYHCTKRKVPRCSQGSLEEQELKAQLETFLTNASLPLRYLEVVLENADKLKEKEKESTEARTENLKSQLYSVRLQLDNLLALKISPQNADGSLLTDAEFSEKKNTLNYEKARLEEMLSSRAFKVTSVVELTKEVFRFSVHAPYWFKNGDPDLQRKIFSAVGSNHTLKDGKLTFQAIKPLVSLQECLFSLNLKPPKFEPPRMPVLPVWNAPAPVPVSVWWALVNDVRTAVAEGGLVLENLKLPEPADFSTSP